MQGSQSSATQVDDRRKTSKREVILPQAMWEVQAIREVGQEKLMAEDGKESHVELFAPLKYDRFFRKLDKEG